MPFVVLAAGGGYKWIKLHDATRQKTGKSIVTYEQCAAN